MNSKSGERAAVCRAEGNMMFQRKMYKEALMKYSEAVQHAPRQSEVLAVAFGNRSAVLYRLQQYKECLSDINEAISTGFPVGSLHKLLLRKAQCLHQLGSIELQQECLEELQSHLLKMPLDGMKKDDVLKEMEALKESSPCTDDNQPDEGPPCVSYGINPVLVQASSAVSLQHNPQQGRFLVACSPIKAGDTLIVEKPFAAVLLPDHYPTHCHHCFGKIKIAYPCRQCTQVKYCSPTCARLSWDTYHQFECHYLQLLHSVGIAHLSLRVVLVAGLRFLLEFREKQKHFEQVQQVAGLDENGQYCRNYQTVYDLMTHAEDMSTEDLFQYTMTAKLLLKILKHSGWFSFTSLDETTDSSSRALNKSKVSQNQQSQVCNQEQNSVSSKTEKLLVEEARQFCKDIKSNQTKEKDQDGCDKFKNMCISENTTSDNDENSNNTEEERFIGELLLRHILQLVCNAHAITELQCSQMDDNTIVEEKSQVRIATAIYPTASLMNHSCDPTIISSRDVLVVRAIKDVPAGGEIFNCYGPHFGRMEFTERQRCLREQYFFHCQCRPCTDGESIQLKFEWQGFKSYEGLWGNLFLKEPRSSICFFYPCHRVLADFTPGALVTAYRCRFCSGPAVLTGSDIYVCDDCKVSCSVDPVKVQEADALFQGGIQFLHDNQIREALTKLQKCYTVRREIMYKYNRQLSEVQDCLARCHAMSGNFIKAAEFLQGSIEIVEQIFGTESIEVANELQKLSEILISAQKWHDALTANQKACCIFEMHYGKSHDIVKELTAARMELLQIVNSVK